MAEISRYDDMIYRPEDRCRCCAEPPGEYLCSRAVMLRLERMLPPRLTTGEPQPGGWQIGVWKQLQAPGVRGKRLHRRDGS
jgi:hypothetical protein